VFADLTTKQLRSGVFKSVAALEAAALAYLDERNSNARPFAWTADAQTILGRVAKNRAGTLGTGNYLLKKPLPTRLEPLGRERSAALGAPPRLRHSTKILPAGGAKAPVCLLGPFPQTGQPPNAPAKAHQKPDGGQ